MKQPALARRIALAVGLLGLVLGALWLRSMRPARALLPEAPSAEDTTPAAELERPSAHGGSALDLDRAAVRTAEGNDSAQSRRTPEESETFASLVIRVTWSDGTPAEGVVVRVVPWGSPDPFRFTRTAATGPDGTLRMQGLHPGMATIYGDRGGNGRKELVAGQEASFEMTLGAGVQVDGRVVDEHGLGVALARVWLSGYGSPSSGEFVTRTDASGRFALRDVGESRYLGARAAGHAPSATVEVFGAIGETIEVELTLPGPGGALELFVRGADGAPAPEAAVRVSGEQADRSPGHLRRGRPAPTEGFTDESGRLLVEGLAPAELEVLVRQGMHATWSERVAVVAGATTRVDVDLRPGASLVGRVLDANGEPAAGVFVGVGPYGAFEASQTTTGEDGSFRLDGLATGRLEVRAEARERGEARATLELAAGTETRWEARLIRGSTVGGRVVDHADEPLEGWHVAAVAADSPGLWLSKASTAGGGTFLLEGCPAEAFVLAIRPPDDAFGDPAVLFREFEPGDRDLLIEIPLEAVRSARIVGRVRTTEGSSPAQLRMILWSIRTDSGREVDADGTGRFDVGPLRPGAYRLEVEAKGMGTVSREKIVLAPNEVLDLGDIVLERAGWVVVSVTAPDGKPAEGAWCLLIHPGGDHASIDLLHGEGRSAPLAPGFYTLRAHGSGLRAPDRSVRVVAGSAARVQLELEPATSRVVVARLPEPSRGGAIHIEARNAEGTSVWAMSLTVSETSEEARVLVTGLGLGRYTVEAATDGGLFGSTSFTVEDVEAPGGTSLPPVELELR